MSQGSPQPGSMFYQRQQTSLTEPEPTLELLLTFASAQYRCAQGYSRRAGWHRPERPAELSLSIGMTEVEHGLIRGADV